MTTQLTIFDFPLYFVTLYLRSPHKIGETLTKINF